MRKGVWKLAIGITLLLLAACGSAPQVATTTSAPAVTAAPAAPSAAAPATLPAATAAASLPVPQSAFTDHPNDTAQARLRLAHLVSSGPNIDFFINGDTAMFTVVAPTAGTGGCRQDYAWANAAFYPGHSSVCKVQLYLLSSRGRMFQQALLRSYSPAIRGKSCKHRFRQMAKR
jgi:hypothetical protein